MQKCYIAGKVSGLDEKVYRSNFRRAEIAVSVLGYEPVNPVELPHDHDRTWQSYMREAMIEMLKCDLVYAQSNWQESHGASLEIELAKELQMPIIYQKYGSN
jgi:hypothetical protein